jgi:16S rRNA (adenine1518-N6/adenine1519-N6)-dimethyltransferase
MNPKKSLGQNFLRDYVVVQQVVSAISPQKDEICVEVGPGEGVITKYLVESEARVMAVELDDELVEKLKKSFITKKNIVVIHDDILKVFLMQELLKTGWAGKSQEISFRVVGNLPYYITSAIIRLFLEMQPKPKEMFFMVQKEVAERIIAKPGDMSILAVAVQYYAEAKILFPVSRESFFPVPKVESAFVKIVPKTRSDNHDAQKVLFRIVRAGFSSRRKMLANTLSSSLHISKDIVISLLRSAEIDAMARAQDLRIEDWELLTKNFLETQALSLQ